MIIEKYATCYVVSEGYSNNNGVILTQISGTVIYLPGDSFNDPVVAGTFNSSFQYSDTQNTANFTNQYTARSANDVYYKFTLGRKMLVTMTHCDLAFSNTYMHLLNVSGSLIVSNDNYYGEDACPSSAYHSFIQRTLEAGTYYIVSEAYSGSGLITTNITGFASEEFDYPDIPNAYSPEAEAVGSPGGALNVSATGGAVYSIPIEVPAGIGGLQPSLAIAYNSQSGNGMAGWGTNLSGLSAITRAPKDIYHDGTAKGLTHLADEAYYLNGQRLIYSSGTAGQEEAVYYPESDPFTKVTVHGIYNTSTANTWFEVQASDGMKYYYGNTASGRLTYYAGSAPRIHAWYLDYVEDPLGNYMTYTYDNWYYFMYPTTITYGDNKNTSTGLQNTVSFGYEYRDDATPFVVDENVKGSMSYRLKTITSKTGSNVYRTYDLQYNTPNSDYSTTKFSRLTSITEKNGAGEALKPVKLEWAYLPSFYQYPQTPSVEATYVPLGIRDNTVAFSDQSYMAADLNGDGLDDLIGIFPYFEYISNDGGFSTNIAFINWASLNSSGNVQFTTSSYYNIGGTISRDELTLQKQNNLPIDFDGDGINELIGPEIRIFSKIAEVVFHCLSNTMQNTFKYELQCSREMPVYATCDFNNNGKGNIIYIEKGHSSNKYPGGILWHDPGRTDTASLNLTLSSKPEKMFVSDYNGDGLQDILVFYNGGYTIFWNQGNGISNTTFSELGTVTESGVKSWNTTFYIPSETYTKTTVDGKTAETNVTLTVTDKNSKKYFAYPATQTDKDLDGNTVTTTRQFNTSYGYMTEEKADFGNNMYKTVQYGTYVLAGKSYKPRLITKIQKHTDDASSFTQKTYITYNADKGYREQVVENYGSSLPLTTGYTYDAFGNVKTSTVSGSGVAQLATYRVYDATQRFVGKIYTSPESSVSSFTYNTWGNVLTEKDETNAADILTTTHTYDNWGNRTSTVFPDGRKTTFRSGWNNNPQKRFFTLTQGTGQPWVKTWYDNKGHEVLSETVGPKSMNVQKKTAYNSKGQILQQQVITGSLTTTETYGYDGRGRVNSFSNSAGQNVTYTYGNRTVTTLTNGKTYTKTTDAWGNIKSSEDPETSVSYTYKSLGKPQSVTADEATFFMTYYNTGMQQTLTDPNAGKSTYTYDAAGRLTQSVDGRGKTTKNKYDALGRIDTTTIDGTVTAYTYGTSGYDLLRLTKQQTGNNSIAYSHDRYGRVTSETRQIDGAGTLSFMYSYNTKGELHNTSYPGGLTVDRQYDAYGNLQKVLAGTQTIWELTGENGLVTTSQLGGTLTSTITRNSQGLLTNLKMVKNATRITLPLVESALALSPQSGGAQMSAIAPNSLEPMLPLTPLFGTLHNMDYVFNGATGNLTSRNGMTGQTESFLYDDLDRLTDVQQGNATVMSTTYRPNGNIDTKTGLGQYEYEDLPHAVSFVENTDELISSNNQNITYTAFDKVSRITEKVGAENYQLDVVYGPDRQRWKSTLKKDNSITKTIVFAGDYETITENGTTKNLYYISGGNGLAAIYVKQSGQTDNIYYPCTDHLGSIVKLITNTGSEVFKASYDAWGNRTVTTNTFAFHRGYTGHEHLTEFKLINMNGRMYDPVLGRFLSPDPFVQAPDFSQSFNRYTYCLNNPLKYTDPTGENPLLIAILLSAFINTAIQGISGNINSTGDFWKAMGIGALAGAAGYGAGSLVSGAIQFGGFAGGSLIGAAGGAAGGFVGGAGNVWANGASFGDGLKAGLIGGGTGAIVGGITGGLIRGISDYKNGYDFWDGSRFDDVLTGDITSANGDVKKIADSYNSSFQAEYDTDILQEKMLKIYDVKEGDYSIKEITTRTTKGKYGLTTEGKYYKLSTNEIVGGYTMSNSNSLSTSLHVSPYYTNGDIVLFKAVAGHELIHAYHYYAVPGFTRMNSERVAYKYSVDVLVNNGRFSTAMSLLNTAHGLSYWGTYPFQYGVLPYRLYWRF